jgi:hypothetical protein
MKNTTSQAAVLALKNPNIAEPCPDFAISYHGTVSLFHPLTNSAADWLRLHCPCDGEHLYFGDALAIEHRFVASIVQRAIGDGLSSATLNARSN